MDIQGLFTRRWPYKLAAVVLSILLWLSVSEAELAEQAVPTRLEIQVSDSAWSLSEVRPSDITTTFRGQRDQVFAALFEENVIRKVIAEGEVEDSILELPLSASEVIYNPELGVEPVEVSPSVVTIRLEERMRKRVAVTGRTDARAAPGAFVVGISTAPDSVWLQGPASFVVGVSEVTTELLAVGAVSSRVTQQLGIALPPDLAGVSVEPPDVIATVEVDSLLTRSFETPVTVRGTVPGGGPGGGAGDVTFTPPVVVASVSGPAGVVGVLDPADIVLTVEIPEFFDGEGTLPVRFRLPPEVAATVTVDLDPARVGADVGSEP